MGFIILFILPTIFSIHIEEYNLTYSIIKEVFGQCFYSQKTNKQDYTMCIE